MSRWNVNLKSVFLSCHFVLPIMESQSCGGAVICVASRYCRNEIYWKTTGCIFGYESGSLCSL